MVLKVSKMEEVRRGYIGLFNKEKNESYSSPDITRPANNAGEVGVTCGTQEEKRNAYRFEVWKPG
jgi:hypothetical protein